MPVRSSSSSRGRGELPRDELVCTVRDAIASMSSRPGAGVVLVAGIPGSGRRTVIRQALRSTGGSGTEAGTPAPVNTRAVTYIGDLQTTADAEDTFDRARAAGQVVVACIHMTGQHPLLRRIRATEVVETVHVPPLELDEVVDACRILFSAPPSARLAGELWRLSGGVFGLLVELVKTALQSGAVQPGRRTVEVAAPVELSLDAYAACPALNQLDDTGRSALQRLALIEPAPRALVRRVIGADALDSTTRSGLVAVIPADVRRPECLWIPAQAVAKTLRAGASEQDRSEVYDTVLRYMSAHSPAMGTTRAIAWALDRGRPVPAPRVLAAAREANTIHHYPLAARLCTSALATGEVDCVAGLIRERVFALRFAGDPEAAIAEVHALQQLPDRSPEDRITDSTLLADLVHYEHDDLDAALELLQTHCDTDDPALAVERVAHLAYGGRFADCERAHRALPALPVAAQARAGIAYSMVQSFRGDPLSALRRLYGYSLLRTIDQPRWFAEELAGALFVCLNHAHGPARVRGVSRVLNGPAASPYFRQADIAVLAAQLSIALSDGRVDDAVALGLAAETGDLDDRSGFRAHVCALSAAAAAYAGDTALSRRLEGQHEQTPQRSSALLRPDGEAALCAAAFARQDPDAAERARTCAQHYATAQLWGAAVRVAHSGVRFGDPECAQIASRAAPYVEGEVLTTMVAHARAVASENALQLHAAAQGFLRIGMGLSAIETLQLAAHYAESGGLSDVAESSQTQASLLASLVGPIRAPHLRSTGAAPTALSRRERQIALLVTQGASNKDIASTLTLSVRTIEGHLGRIYTKLGLSGRRELGRHIIGTR